MKGMVALALLAASATASWAATCMPSINNAPAIDGVVAGGNLQGPVKIPAGCSTTSVDLGWGGIPGRGIDVVAGSPGTKTPTLFLTAHQSAGKVDKIYLALHVEKAPDFSTNDKLTIYFAANAGENDWDASKDFALVFDGIGPFAGTPTAPQPLEGCTSPGGQMRYYTRDADHWVPQASVPATIVAKISYAYDPANDPQFPLWELEVSIDVSSLNIVPGAQIGLGAKLYLFEAGVASTTAYHYPGPTTDQRDLTPTPDAGADFLPNQGDVTPVNLDKVPVAGCTLALIISRLQGFDADGNPGQFTLLSPSSPADFDQATGMALRQNHFTAVIGFANTTNANDASRVAVTETGNVTFSIAARRRTFGRIRECIGPERTIPLATFAPSFNQLGQQKTISFQWPANKSEFRGLLFPCRCTLRAALSGVNINPPTGNDPQQGLRCH